MLMAKCIANPSTAYDGDVNAAAPTSDDATNCQIPTIGVLVANVRKASMRMPPRMPPITPAPTLTAVRSVVPAVVMLRSHFPRHVATFVEIKQARPRSDVDALRC